MTSHDHQRLLISINISQDVDFNIPQLERLITLGFNNLNVSLHFHHSFTASVYSTQCPFY